MGRSAVMQFSDVEKRRKDSQVNVSLIIGFGGGGEPPLPHTCGNEFESAFC